MANVGDKYIIEIGEIIETGNGNLYRVKGFNRLVFDQHGLNKLEKAEEREEAPETIEGFAELARLLAAGAKIEPGQKVDCVGKNGAKTEWAVIETRTVGFVIVAQRTVSHYSNFSEPTKDHPWGSNDYAISKPRTYLNGEFLANLDEEDAAVIVPRGFEEIGEERDPLWLLSKDEVDGVGAFEWFRDEDHRRMKDWEGDKCHWFLRGPFPSRASLVRSVNTDGSLSDSVLADYATGLVAACIIRKSGHLPA